MITSTIARNSVWYTVETLINNGLSFVTSIAIARYIGPAKLGYFLYVWWALNVAFNLGGLGIPTATRKYMSEFYGRGEPGIARAVFFQTLRYQFLLALAVTAGGLTLVYYQADPEFRIVSLLMVASLLPCMVNAVPAQANVAAENMASNIPGTAAASATFLLVVGLSVAFGWGLTGIAAGMLAMRSAEVCTRMLPVLARMHGIEAAPLPAELHRRMFLFSGRSVILMLFGLVVWDRSELLFLKAFCADIRQVAFYSVAFNITERLILIPQIFGEATGASLMVQYGRDQTRQGAMVEVAVRYLALIGLPVHLGLWALAGPAILAIYGRSYEGAVAALAIAAVLGMAKVFRLPAHQLLESTENQGWMIRFGILFALVNIGLDFALIPKFGAVGAAWANGVTQTLFVLALWIVATRLFDLRLPYGALARIALAALAMAAGIYVVVHRLNPYLAIAIGVPLGTFLYLGALRFARILQPEDYARFQHVRRQLPSGLHRAFDFGLGWLIPT